MMSETLKNLIKLSQVSIFKTKVIWTMISIKCRGIYLDDAKLEVAGKRQLSDVPFKMCTVPFFFHTVDVNSDLV